MAIRLHHPFSTTKTIDETYASIVDLERIVPCVEGGSVLMRFSRKRATGRGHRRLRQCEK